MSAARQQPLREVAGRSHGPDSITAITSRLRRFTEERDWGQFHTPKNLAVSISIESAELLEHFQWSDERDGQGPDVCAVGLELADVAIYVMRLADTLGISLARAIDEKIAENHERYPVAKARGSSKKYSALG